MAIATEEITDQTDATATDNDNDDDVTSEKTKRERVDLEKLDPNEKVMLSIAIPAGMKLKIMQAGEQNELVASAHARNVLAQAFGYEILASFTERTRSSKYGTPEEAKAAAAARAKAQRDEVKAVMAAIKAGRISRADIGLAE